MVHHIRQVLLLAFAVALAGCSSTPRFAGMGADDLFALSEEHFQDRKWNDAIEALERLLFVFPTYAQAADARMLLANTFFEKREFVSAAAEYNRFLERHPTSPMVATAALGVCRSYARLSPDPQRDQSYTRQAVTACQNVALDYPGSVQADEAENLRDEMLEKLSTRAYQVGDFYLRRGLYDSAIMAFESVVERYPATSMAPRALLQLHRTYERLGWGPEADEARQRLLNLYPASTAAREVVNGP